MGAFEGRGRHGRVWVAGAWFPGGALGVGLGEFLWGRGGGLAARSLRWGGAWLVGGGYPLHCRMVVVRGVL